MKIEAATLAGGEVNQDRYIIGPNFAAVLDGASAFGGNPSGYDGGWYAEQLATRLKRLLTDRPDDDTANLVADAITDIRDTFRLVPETSPTSTLALVRWNADTIDCYVLGDSTIALIHVDGTETVITDDRIKQFGAELREKYRADLRAGGGFGEQHRATLTALQAEQAKHRNVEGGYWIAGMHSEAAHHAAVDRSPARSLLYAILHTDGIRTTPKVSRYGGTVTHMDLAEIAKIAACTENLDAEGAKDPRSKFKDDKTIVIVHSQQKDRHVTRHE